MANPDGVSISVLSALRAHFKQPSGPSRAGADWTVRLSGGEGQEEHITVRTYADEVGRISEDEEAGLVVRHVAQLLESGWSPAQYRGTPGELLVGRPASSTAPAAVPSAPAKQPWWRRLLFGS